MSKKFFSLIHGETVHIAPETRVLKADALATLIDAKGVLESVQKDAKQYRMEIASECEKEREKAQKEGFEEGFKEWAEQIVALEEEIKKVRANIERVIVPVALKAAKKIVGRELETSDTVIVDIVANALSSVSQHKKIIIYVNKNDLDILEKNRKNLKSIFESLEVLLIQPRDDIATGGCIIETEGGIINAQLENQWIILETAFQKLMSPTKKKE